MLLQNKKPADMANAFIISSFLQMKENNKDRSSYPLIPHLLSGDNLSVPLGTYALIC
jgi:hypothetical protein